MPVYVSASSRLHALLTALEGVDGSRPLRDAWSKVLGISHDDVAFGRFGLPLVAELVSRAREEARRADEFVGLPLRKDLVAEWSEPLNAPGGNLASEIQQHRVSAEALKYLESVASVLRMRESHQELPAEDERSELLSQIDDLFASVAASTELRDDVKEALLRRISQVRFAVDNARIGGPEGVHQAVELLVGATAVRGKFIPNWTFKKVLAVAGVVYAVFSAGPAIQASLEAWPQVAEAMHLSTGGTQDTNQTDEHEPVADDREPKP